MAFMSIMDLRRAVMDLNSRSKFLPLHSVSEDGRACQECMSPALGGVMLQQAHSRYDSHAADTNAPYNKRTHAK